MGLNGPDLGQKEPRIMASLWACGRKRFPQTSDFRVRLVQVVCIYSNFECGRTLEFQVLRIFYVDFGSPISHCLPNGHLWSVAAGGQASNIDVHSIQILNVCLGAQKVFLEHRTQRFEVKEMH